MTNWLDIISSVLGLACVLLAGRRLVANFWLGYVYNIFLFFLFWKQGLYASMAIQTVAFSINAIGHWRWTHPAQQEQDSDGALAISHLELKDWLVSIPVLLGVAAGLYVILVRTNDPQPILDSSCTALILLAQWLSAQKKWECWIVWLVVNVANLILYLRAGLSFMPVVAGLYIANGLWSLFSWKKHEKGNS